MFSEVEVRDFQKWFWEWFADQTQLHFGRKRR